MRNGVIYFAVLFLSQNAEASCKWWGFNTQMWGDEFYTEEDRACDQYVSRIIDNEKSGAMTSQDFQHSTIYTAFITNDAKPQSRSDTNQIFITTPGLFYRERSVFSSLTGPVTTRSITTPIHTEGTDGQDVTLNFLWYIHYANKFELSICTYSQLVESVSMNDMETAYSVKGLYTYPYTLSFNGADSPPPIRICWRQKELSPSLFLLNILANPTNSKGILNCNCVFTKDENEH